MIVYRFWTRKRRDGVWIRPRTWSGWFLFGILPLYVRLEHEGCR